MYKIRRTEDVEEARDAHRLAFPADAWVGDDHEYWLAYDEQDAVVGFCCAVHDPKDNTVFLSRAAVTLAARGAGLQRRMIYARVRWARRIGASAVYTYTLAHNYESMANLLRCGFHFTDSTEKGWHSFKMMLRPM